MRNRLSTKKFFSTERVKCMNSIVNRMAKASVFIVLLNVIPVNSNGIINNPILESTCYRSLPAFGNNPSFLTVGCHTWLLVPFNFFESVWTGGIRIYEFDPTTGSVKGNPTCEKILPSPTISNFLVFDGVQARLILFGGNPFQATPTPPLGFIQVYEFDPITGRCGNRLYEESGLDYYFYNGGLIQDNNHLYVGIVGAHSAQQPFGSFLKVFAFDFVTGGLTLKVEKTYPDNSQARTVAWFNHANKYLACGQSATGIIDIYTFDMNTGLLSTDPINTVIAPSTPWIENLDFLHFNGKSYLAVANANQDNSNAVLQIYTFNAGDGQLSPQPIQERIIPPAPIVPNPPNTEFNQLLYVKWDCFPYYLGAVGIGFTGLYLFDPISGTLSENPIAQPPLFADWVQGLAWYQNGCQYMVTGGKKIGPASPTSGFVNVYRITSPIPLCK